MEVCTLATFKRSLKTLFNIRTSLFHRLFDISIRSCSILFYMIYLVYLYHGKKISGQLLQMASDHF